MNILTNPLSGDQALQKYKESLARQYMAQKENSPTKNLYSQLETAIPAAILAPRFLKKSP